MVGRAFSVKIDLDIHAVSCPGVWLCPNGKVSLQINIFNSCSSTKKLTSTFPILYHNRFTFKKIFIGVSSLAELEKKLFKEYIFTELIQWSSTANKNICLATFETNLVDLLYPVSSFKGLLAGVDVDLLMEPTNFFPGILSPKIEISTKTTIEELTDFDPPKTEVTINPKIINSANQRCIHKKTVALPSREIKQKKVCHTGQQKVNSYLCRICRRQKNITKNDCGHNRCNECNLHSSDKCYLFTVSKPETCNCSTTTLEKPQNSRQNYLICEDTHIFDNCPICFKYKCYFSKNNSNYNSLSKLSNYQNFPKKCLENKKKLASGFRCVTNYEHYANRASMISSSLDSLNLENNAKNSNYKLNSEDTVHQSCILEKFKNSSIFRSNSMSSLKVNPISSILLDKMKQLEDTKMKLNYSKYPYRNSDCNLTNGQSNEIKKGFYRNLEKFYKRMYKQAKKRAYDLNET